MPLRWRISNVAGLFLIANLALAVAGYFTLNGYLCAETQKFVLGFLATESENLQEGQILQTFSRSQKLLIASEFIKGVTVFDIRSGKRLYETGQSISNQFAAPKLGESKTETEGLFHYRVLSRINDDLVSVFEAAWPYAIYQFLSALISIVVMTIWLSWYSANQSKKTALARWEANNRANLQLASFAAQVAHDIRSPLSALKIAITQLDNIPPEVRGIVLSASKRIQDIAEDMLSVSKTKSIQSKQASEDLSLYNICLSLVNEKILEYSHRSNLTIALDGAIDSTMYTTFPPADLQRILSNLINNSIEASGDLPARIRMNLYPNGNTACITIADNGPGIPDEVLKRLGRERISHGKNGNGLGVLGAVESIERHRGRLEILSKIGHGTQVRIHLPLNIGTGT